MKIRPYLYHYTGECPSCRSRRTGRILVKQYMSPIDADYLCAKYLKKGELVLIKTFGDTQLTTFCYNCNAQWYGEVRSMLISKEERDFIKYSIGITDEWIREKEIETMVDGAERTKNRKIKEKKVGKFRKVLNYFAKGAANVAITPFKTLMSMKNEIVGEKVDLNDKNIDRSMLIEMPEEDNSQ